MIRKRTTDEIAGNIKEFTIKKLQYIIHTRQPRRIWTVSLLNDVDLQLWLMTNGWRKDLGSNEPLMPLQLYVPDTATSTSFQ